VNKLITDKNTIISDFRLIETKLFDVTELEAEKHSQSQELEVVSELIQKAISENARTVIDQTEYRKEYDRLAERFDCIKKQLDEVVERLSEKRSKKEVFRKFISDLERQEELLTEFDSALWTSLVDFITVNPDGSIEVTFKNGNTITAFQ
jgi:uncharacterized tellurite resistance protein B-like protein